jgi:hypothetical protein
MTNRLFDKTFTSAYAEVEAESGTSLLDAMVEAGAQGPTVNLDKVTAPATGFSRGRRLVVRDVVIVAQDSDLLCQGGLFGSVEATAPQGHWAAVQQSLIDNTATVDVRTGGSVCVCGDGGCDIGPFVAKGGR